MLPDLVYVLTRVIIDDRDDVKRMELTDPEASLRPSQMATNLLERLISILS